VKNVCDFLILLIGSNIVNQQNKILFLGLTLFCRSVEYQCRKQIHLQPRIHKMSRYNITVGNLDAGCEFGVGSKTGEGFDFRVRWLPNAAGGKTLFVDVNGVGGYAYLGVYNPAFTSRADAIRLTAKSPKGERFTKAAAVFAWAAERILYDAGVPVGYTIEGYQEPLPVPSRTTPIDTIEWQEIRGEAPADFARGLEPVAPRRPRARRQSQTTAA
jgi:hypothetical protein